MRVKPNVNFFFSDTVGARRSFFKNLNKTKIIAPKYGTAVKIPPTLAGNSAAITPTIKVSTMHKAKNQRK
ncbi:Uncharacterised protein [Acinetobacter baumannii]|nr:Uncharacterised protein [Acinetobacter baumannii]